MSALQEADKAVDEFVNKYVLCSTCIHWTPKSKGGVCNGPEIPVGYIEDDTGRCEQHEFKDKELEKQLDVLTGLWSNAWYIVEGFMYEFPHDGNWEDS